MPYADPEGKRKNNRRYYLANRGRIKARNLARYYARKEQLKRKA